MAHKICTGIIISHLPYKGQILIFTQEWGMLYFRAQAGLVRSVVHGEMVIASGVTKGDAFIAETLEVQKQIAAWCIHDLVFFHHILELYRLSTPLASPSPELYTLLLLLFRTKAPKDFNFFKKIFICKFFSAAALIPERATERDLAPVVALISRDADSMFENQEDRYADAELCTYVHACYEAHPYVHRFKTRTLVESGLI